MIILLCTTFSFGQVVKSGFPEMAAKAGIFYVASALLPISQLRRVNLATGEATSIGLTGLTDLQGLAI